MKDYMGCPVRVWEEGEYYRNNGKWYGLSSHMTAKANTIANLEFLYQKELKAGQAEVVKITPVNPKSKTIDKLLKVA